MDSLKKNVAIFIAVIVLCALGGYVVYNKAQSTKTSKPIKNDSVKKVNTDNLVSKIDDTKDWVYDAEYKGNTTTESYSTSYKTYYLKDIVVPFINVNSSYAKVSNSAIKKIFDDAIENYNMGVSDQMTYVNECGYKKYINSDILSIILTYGVGGTDVVHPEYYTYNIDLKNGEPLTYEQVYTIAGFDSSNIDSKVESAITKAMKEELSNFSFDDETTFNNYNNESISNYKNSVKNNNLKYYLSDNGKLSIVVELSIPAGSGSFDTIITVE